MIKGYSVLSEAFYGKREIEESPKKITDQVSFGHYSESGGTTGEAFVTWDKFGPQLHCYDEGWAMLAENTKLIEEMGKLNDCSVFEFCATLERCGFVDSTKRER